MPRLNVIVSRLVCLVAVLIVGNVGAEELRPDLDYFPSRLHAVIFRNWDIVPHERIAAVLETDVATVRKCGKTMGLAVPKPLTAEEVRRNVEIVLRRNWPLLPRTQIDQLLNYSAKETDDFLAKEIFLRALLAGQPAGLTPVKCLEPDEHTAARAKWFGEHVSRHLEAVASSPEEPRLAFTNSLCRAHDPANFVRGAKPSRGDADLRSFRKIQLPANPSKRLKDAAEDFVAYCHDVQHATKLQATDKPDSFRRSIFVSYDPTLGPAYKLSVEQNSISISGSSDEALSRAFVELERRMAERGGPFLSRTVETNTPSFTPRYVSSYFSLMTDVLGQDLIDPFPDGYLNQIYHQDADGIWVYALLEDLVPSTEFPEIGTPGNAERLQRLRKLVDRAAKRGLKVFIYLNEPRDQPLSFFEKYPDVKGHVEGGRAMLCTSTARVQKHLHGAFEKLFREVPGLGGVFVITASENWTNCYSRTRNTNCPRCSKRPPADVIAEVIRSMAEGAWAADPKAKFIVWDWSWHSVLGEEAPEQIIAKLPKGVGLMADFERGTHITRGGIPMNVEEYSISIIGPSPRAKSRSEQAKQFGFDYLAKIQLSTTWECGTVPFIPVPNLLARKAQALRDVGTSGLMETWTIGSYPSPNTEAFAVQQWNPQLSEAQVLQRVAAKRYGSDAAGDVVRGWTKLSNAFTEEYPFPSSPYAGPLQHGPSLPWYRRDIPPPYGNVTLFNCKDDWRRWTAPYPQDVMAKLLRHLCERWDEGLADLRAAEKRATGERRKQLKRDNDVAWMVGYYYRAYANTLEFYGARDAGDAKNMKRFAEDEIKHTEQALRFVRADSRIGWEAELQYFYRPSDVLERLISLDALVEPMP